MKDTNKLNPEVRFSGFTDDWEQRKLEEIASVYDGVHQTPEYKDEGIMFLSVENIATLTSKKYISEEAYERNFKVRPAKGDILMTRIGDVGTPNVVETSERLAYYVSLALLKPRGINSYFLNNAIQSSSFQHGLRERTLLTAVPMKINKDEIGKVDIFYPVNSDEQRKIGESFKQLDNLITLHQRKLNGLKNVKKAMLEKMFPKNGESVPEIRFSGFTDDWEQREFGEILNVYPFKQYIKEPESNGKYKIIQQGNEPIIGYANGKPFEEYENIVLFGDHTVSLYKPQAPFFVATDGVKILGTTKNLDGNFFNATLEKYKPESEGYKRHFSILKKQRACFTENSDEQRRVGNFFKNLDHLITLHQRKLDKLKTLKKAMLEKMFI
ncbi:restriction endonuclease subunit S [Streptococcus equinus]|uniref:restriction endonuclease subunit S n=1 Tax=Streptococcus equinus TaxID=1335 RepID=UPI00040792D2|nr:restriction endonuclease subunit S [Streptococcus equinus]